MNLAEVHSTSELAEFQFESCFGLLGVAGALAIEDFELCDTCAKCQQRIRRPNREPILPNIMVHKPSARVNLNAKICYCSCFSISSMRFTQATAFLPLSFWVLQAQTAKPFLKSRWTGANSWLLICNKNEPRVYRKLLGLIWKFLKGRLAAGLFHPRGDCVPGVCQQTQWSEPTIGSHPDQACFLPVLVPSSASSDQCPTDPVTSQLNCLKGFHPCSFVKLPGWSDQTVVLRMQEKK